MISLYHRKQEYESQRNLLHTDWVETCYDPETQLQPCLGVNQSYTTWEAHKQRYLQCIWIE